MSIRITQSKCVGCGMCIEACPGNLIKKNSDGKAYMLHERDCWGCTSCIKECKAGAIRFFLGADIGGRGSTLSVSEKNNISTWKIEDPNGNVKIIEVNKNDANKY